ncbi:MAG: glutathione S-transferase family protein [Rhodospirillaceae bacterium]|nr:glutathione S-transferase family protein [Rhodospirillaceae bacterium]MYB14944.1 glutathione S-transferase family protein [Rhodospirillaceae bacterium]MYI47615.1 glutathione S-transferase family protein [Rhodospirillaceae bacterium]
MAVIVPTDRSVETFEGIHLYHGDISNCSMRVRMTLIEKGLPWTSHHLDLKKKENISDAYFGINPNGLVPTLIDNGVVHIESNEIIDYLDLTYPEPSLRAAGDRDGEDGMLEWLRLAASIHEPAVKPYVYATKMQKKLKKTAEEQRRYDALQKNEELKEFHARHAGDSAFDEKDIARAREILEDCFARLENALADREWIMGDRFTLADISWIPLHFVLVGCRYPFESYSNISRWAAALRDRQSYKDGILKWCPDFSKV